MKRCAQKAFTIVELVVVIAVVAVLAAIIIPSCVNLIKTAKFSADCNAVYQMNQQLAIAETENKVSDIEKVKDVLRIIGYELDDYQPLSNGYSVTWDSGLNRILLLDEEGEVVYPQTYADSAEAIYCPECGALLSDALVFDEAVPPTCTETGLTQGSHCSVCGYVVTAQETVAAAGHKFQTIIDAEPTCTESGRSYDECVVCNILTNETKLPALGHDYGEYVYQNDATCTTDGTEVSSCSRCESTLTRTAKGTALGHDYNEEGVCVRCGAIREDLSQPVWNSDKTTVTFGAYPQSEVLDSALISVLGALAGLPTDEKSNWSDYGYYLTGYMQSYMWYIDISLYGVRYRGVYFTSERSAWTDNDGSAYQSKNGYLINTVYWFRYDPLVWRVLSEEDGSALLLCETVIDAQPYQNSYTEQGGAYYIDNDDAPQGTYANNYYYSTIRSWLNDTFYETAFYGYEKSLIIEAEVKNGADSVSDASNQFVSINSVDKIFLLSEREAVTEAYGFNTNLSEKDDARVFPASDYAKAQGLNTSTSGTAAWYLRSPSTNGTGRMVQYVSATGYAGNTGRVNMTYVGILPAMRLSEKGI